VKIYTIGHSNLSAERIIDLLCSNGIQILVDVRSVPYSEFNPQFNRERFQRSLEQAGIQYQYLGEALGGRPQDPSCYNGGKALYQEIAKKSWYQEGIAKLLELASQKKTAILCSEEDPQRCHRHRLITQTLLEREVEVIHIRGDGRLEVAERLAEQLPLFEERG